jgi:hypothetical protein
VDKESSNIELFDEAEAKERKTVKIERNKEEDEGKTCTARCQRLCKRKARAFCLKNPAPNGNVELELSMSEENPLEANDQEMFAFDDDDDDDSNYWKKYGILYVLKKYDDDGFRFLEVGRLENGKVYQREKLALQAFSYIFAFEDGDSNNPAIDWQPNLVESMRVVGWVNFSGIACCHKERCGSWHIALMSALFLGWWVFIIGFYLPELYLVDDLGLAKLMAWLELAIVFVLSIFGYIVSTEVDEGNFEVVVEIQGKGLDCKLIEIDIDEKKGSVQPGDARQSQSGVQPVNSDSQEASPDQDRSAETTPQQP